MSSDSPVKKVDDKVKEYLLQKDLANLLEQFIVSCVESRPDDVLPPPLMPLRMRTR